MSLQSPVVDLIAVVVTLVVVTLSPALASPVDPSASCGQQAAGETVVVCGGCAPPAPMQTPPPDGPIARFCRSVVRDTLRLNCWPEPFPAADREAVRRPFVQMVANGWMRENTLGTHHFEPETGMLNRAGQLKIRAILLEGLPQHRFLCVYRAERATETAARVDAVQQYAAQVVRDGVLPQVIETDIPAPGWPAQWVDRLETKFGSSMPDPRLPKAQNEQGMQSQ